MVCMAYQCCHDRFWSLPHDVDHTSHSAIVVTTPLLPQITKGRQTPSTHLIVSSVGKLDLQVSQELSNPNTSKEQTLTSLSPPNAPTQSPKIRSCTPRNAPPIAPRKREGNLLRKNCQKELKGGAGIRTWTLWVTARTANHYTIQATPFVPFNCIILKIYTKVLERALRRLC